MSRFVRLRLVFAILHISVAFAAWTMQEFRDRMKAWASSADLLDPTDALESWRNPLNEHLCHFDGIDCYYYYDNYWISSVNLDNLDLVGSIPSWMWATATDTINLSNNQWYNTTVFYEDTSNGPEQDATVFLKTLNCSNCGFFLKAEEGTTVLPEEWSRYTGLHTFDISHNPSLIGQLPASWATRWTSISDVHIQDTPICEPFPFPKEGSVRVYGDYMALDQCPELPEIPPWEPEPPEPPAFPPSYIEEEPDAAMDSALPPFVDLYEPFMSPSSESTETPAPTPGSDEVGEAPLPSSTLPSEEAPVEATQSEEIACPDLSALGTLESPELVASLDVAVSFRPNDSVEVPVCEQYHCVLTFNVDDHTAEEAQPASGSEMFWEVSVREEGPLVVTLTVTELSEGLEHCSWTYTTRSVVDVTGPSCDSLLLKDKGNGNYRATVGCSEDVVVTIPSAVAVSENGEVMGIKASGDQLNLDVRRVSDKQATIVLSIPATSYSDLAGNPGSSDLVVEIPVASSGAADVLVDGMTAAHSSEIISGTIVASGGLSTGAAMLGGAGSGGGFSLKTNIVRAGFHLQFLSWTAYLAVPRLSNAYLNAAKRFSWTTLATASDEVIAPSDTQDGERDGRGKLLSARHVQRGETPTEKGDAERDAFVYAIVAYSAFIGSCAVARIAVELFLRRCRPGKERPTIMTFPRLDLQAVAITIPPVTFAFVRLLTVGSAAALQLGLVGLVILVAPFTTWYLCCLTTRNLILRPEVYVDRVRSARLDTSFKKKGEQKLFSTVSGDLIGIQVGDHAGPSTPSLPVVPPHEEEIDDYDNDIERTLSTRVSTSPRTRRESQPTTDAPPRLSLPTARIFPTSSDDEAKLLLRSDRCSTASVAGVELLPSDAPTHVKEPLSANEDTSDDEALAEWRLMERHPERHFIKKYGFAFDDVTSLDPEIARHRLRARYLVTHGGFFLHKVAAAAVFGATAHIQRSPGQVFFLVSIQLLVVGHLLCIRPYVQPSVAFIEITTACLELSILIGASALLFDVGIASINLILIICFYAAAFLLSLYELRHCTALLRRCRSRR